MRVWMRFTKERIIQKKQKIKNGQKIKKKNEVLDFEEQGDITKIIRKRLKN